MNDWLGYLWLLSIPFLILLPTICLFLILRFSYQKTEYFKQTRTPYLKLLRDKGNSGEYYSYKALVPVPGYSRFLFNCYIPTAEGETTEIDLLFLHSSGIYVIESKNYSGWIFGHEAQTQWVQCLPGKRQAKKVPFLNPILQNKGHIRALRDYFGEDIVLPIYSFVVFSNRCTLKKIELLGEQDGNTHILQRKDLEHTVRQKSRDMGHLLSMEEIDALYSVLHPFTQVDESIKQEHIKRVQKKSARQKKNMEGKIKQGRIISLR